ncbi:MAG: WD40/YVTN/BNR-like repeat-containing protein, partial [Acidimicrobiales bacterium]
PGWTVTALSDQGPSVWALITGDTGHPPDDRLATSEDLGTTWSISPVLPQLAGCFGVLDRLSPTLAYAMGTGHPTGEPGLDHIAYTTDAARSWSYVVDPCANPPEAATRLQVLPPTTVWLACAGQATSGYQGKSVYRSEDGGRHWTLAARACFPASGCTPLGQLPAPGYLGDLHATSDAQAWLSLARGNLFETADGGRTWTPALPGGVQVQQGPGVLSFTDSHHGWTIADSGIWSTVNGTTWQRAQ